ncbi:hypothetical protein JTE90_006276 [Oedothorax gibbosus]|uniref:Phosphotyrosine protein phosphatase I domain-containing protein n=1 Tax=Oedothorax gibbosus TaxID=931172 RepID=A0AAV6U7U2_9ARAC|nr:hypothetical protein JTE90_006276 [Oedothorax gibbosus]
MFSRFQWGERNLHNFENLVAGSKCNIALLFTVGEQNRHNVENLLAGSKSSNVLPFPVVGRHCGHRRLPHVEAAGPQGAPVHGVPLRPHMDHRARPLQAEDFTQCDYIFGMDENTISDLKDLPPKNYTASNFRYQMDQKDTKDKQFSPSTSREGNTFT